MSGFELRAQFYPLVSDLERLKEEAAEGVPYPFLAEEVLELSLKDYRQFGNALGQRYAFETDIPKEGYDAVYGAFHCSLVTTASEKRCNSPDKSGRADVWRLSTGQDASGSRGCAEDAGDAGAVPGPGDPHRAPRMRFGERAKAPPYCSDSADRKGTVPS